MRVLSASATAMLLVACLSCSDKSATAPGSGSVGAAAVQRVTISCCSGNRLNVSPSTVTVAVPGSVDFVFSVNGSMNCKLTFGKHTYAPLPPDIDWGLGGRTVRRNFFDQDEEEFLYYSVYCYPAIGTPADGSGYVLVW